MRLLFAATICLALLPGCRRASVAGSPVAPRAHAPQDVFNEAKTAALKNDWRATFWLIDEDDRYYACDSLVGNLVSPEDGAPVLDEARGLFKKHGMEQAPVGEGWMAIYFTERYNNLPYKAAFFADLEAFHRKHPRGERLWFEMNENASLKELHVDGDRASGTLDPGDGKPRLQWFVKRHDRWFFTLSGPAKPSDKPAAEGRATLPRSSGK